MFYLATPLISIKFSISPANFFAEPMDYDIDNNALSADPDHNAATNTFKVEELEDRMKIWLLLVGIISIVYQQLMSHKVLHTCSSIDVIATHTQEHRACSKKI